MIDLIGRSGEIRTPDPLLPKQVRRRSNQAAALNEAASCSAGHREHHPLIVGAITLFHFVAAQLDYARREITGRSVSRCRVLCPLIVPSGRNQHRPHVLGCYRPHLALSLI